ncbi:MAG: FHA domain-containing protein [Polyangiaceae bacterium]|nr:FHA domain-containing protein [Polyangiaceae bacterium]
MIDGPARGQRFEFDERGVLVIGRASDVMLSLPGDDRLSRYHMALEIAPPHVHLRDLDSSNGTYLDGQRNGR